MPPELSSTFPPPSTWRPFRVVIPIAATYISTLIVGCALFILSLILSSRATTCSGLVAFGCIALGIVAAYVTAFAVGTILGLKLLRRKQVGRPFLLLVITFGASTVWGILLGRVLSLLKLETLPLQISLAVISLFIFVAAAVVTDWYLNAPHRPAWLRLVAMGSIILATVAVVIPNRSATNSAALSSNAELRTQLTRANVPYLIPPANSSYPQPYRIATAGDDPNAPNYQQGATISLNTGKQEFVVLYEYKIEPSLDPLTDCKQISSTLVAEYANQMTCKVVKTLPSGTVIYDGASNSKSFFIIKNDVAVIFEPSMSMSDDYAYEFLDNLVPLDVETLIETLHQKNPRNY